MIPNELEEKMVSLGLEKAKAKGEAFMLEKALKGVYAEQYMKARTDKSQGDAAQIAYTTDAYRLAVSAAADAVDRAEASKVRYDAFVARFEAWRSLNSSRREQIKQGVHQ